MDFFDVFVSCKFSDVSIKHSLKVVQVKVLDDKKKLTRTLHLHLESR